MIPQFLSLPLSLQAFRRLHVPPVGRWIAVARERRQLAAMDDRTLADIGLTRADAWAEATRPFWDLPDR